MDAMDVMGAMGPGLMLGLSVLGLILVLVWVFVPFAIIGTKPLLRALLAEQRRTNELLASIDLQRGRPSSDAPSQEARRIEPRL